MDDKPVMEGRQDIQAPDASVEKSDPTAVDEERGQRMWIGIGVVAVLFIIVIIWEFAIR